MIERYNADHGTSFRFHGRAGQAPDLEYRDGSRSLRVEVTAAFYDENHARFKWLAARKHPDAPTSSLVGIATRNLWRILTRHSLPNVRNLTGPTVCLQSVFSPSSLAFGRWKHALRTSAFPPLIALMSSTFAVNSHRQSEARQNAEYGNSRRSNYTRYKTRSTVSPTPAVNCVPVRPLTMCERSCTSAQLATAAGINKAGSRGIVFTAAHSNREWRDKPAQNELVGPPFFASVTVQNGHWRK